MPAHQWTLGRFEAGFSWGSLLSLKGWGLSCSGRSNCSCFMLVVEWIHVMLGCWQRVSMLMRLWKAHNINSKSHNGTVKIISWNVKGLGNPVKRAKVLAHLKSLNPDVVLLQETHAKRSVQMVLCANWLGQMYQANFGARGQGQRSRNFV